MGGTYGRPIDSRLTAMTYNVRYDEPADGRYAWRNRRGAVMRTIRAHHPDLLGLQEPTSGQWQEFAAALPGLSPFGLSGAESEDGAAHGGFFRAGRFTAIDRGVFWLSDTPSVSYSVSWPNDWGPRACSWIKLQDDEAGEQLVFASTHLDTNAGAWLPSARVLHIQLDAVARDLPLVLVGDFNCAAGSDAHRYLCDEAGFRDAWREAGNADEGVLTFNGFTPATGLPDDPQALRRWLDTTSTPSGVFTGAHRNYRIDWILLRGALTARAASIDYRMEDGRLPSDHYPVVAQIAYARLLSEPAVARKPPAQL